LKKLMKEEKAASLGKGKEKDFGRSRDRWGLHNPLKGAGKESPHRNMGKRGVAKKEASR